MTDWQWELGIWGGGTTAWLLAVAFLGLWALEIRSIRGENSRARKLALVALGGVGMLAVYLVALQVTLVRETFEEVTGRTALLVDSSRSMTLAGTDGERRDQVRELIRKWQEQSDIDPIVYLFGSSVRGTSWQSLPDDYDPSDDDTKLREGLKHLLQRGSDEGLGAVVVVTDGGDASFRAGAFSEQPGTPAVHAVVVGGDDPLADQAIVSVQSDPTTYVGVPASIRARVRAVGQNAKQESLRVQLWREDRLVEEQEAALDADGRGEVAFEVTPRRPGRALYRLAIPVESGDAVPENNDRTILLRVGRDRFRVLLVAGHPTWDVRFLREFLKRDASIDLVSFFILRTTSDLTAAPASELALIPFPTDELFREHLGSFDVIIFQNFDYAPYEMEPYLSRIRDYVLRGGSFAMIGGDRSFSAGGYAGTPIQEILPVRLPTAAGAKTEIQERFRVEPAPKLARHPIVALGPEPSITRRMWQELAPVHGANVVRGLRGSGQTLLQRDGARRGARGETPIVVVGEAGEGRVLALMTDSSWRWRFGGKDAAVGSDEYELFWDRALRWLSHDPLLEPARIGSDRERYSSGGDVLITGRLRDRRYAPLADVDVQLKVEANGETLGETVSARTDERGRLKSKLAAPLEPGAYEVVASVDDDELAREAFVVEQNSDELADLEVAPDELASLAKKTGGRAFLSVDDTPPLDELLSTTRKAAGLVARQPLSNPAFLAFTVVLLGLTWFLRRRWGRR